MKDLKKALALGAAALLLLSLCLSLSGCAVLLGALGFYEKPEVHEELSDYGRFFGPDA